MASSITNTNSNGSNGPSDQDVETSKGADGNKQLATTTTVAAELESSTKPNTLGAIILQTLGFRKKDSMDLDGIATQPSIWDSENVEEYKKSYIHPQWENWASFDPSFRWTWREERSVRRKVDWTILLWAFVMFACLNVHRDNISNAVSDNMLDDLGITKGDYNIGQTIFRVAFLVAELPSQLISKRIGPDVWIPIQICIFSVISGLQFFLKGRASFLATRYLIATFQGGFIPDTILYLSYWYTGTALPIRLAWFWMSSQFSEIAFGFASVGLLSMRGVLGYAGWRWLYLIDWWNPRGYFSDHEAKIIVNSVIRDDPHKGGMFNRQGLSVRQIWECTKDYDMWPLYILGLLFGLPKYPVGQYLSLSLRELGFNVVETNLLSIPYIATSCVTMLAITGISELVNNRSLVAMAEDAWLLPCFVALLAMPDPISAWSYFAISTVLLSFPYTHPIQVAWTSRNAGSVQNRTVSASLYNMFVQASGMIGANIYQDSDSPRYKKANTGLLVICIWMCLVQYPATWFYYRWRNNTKTKIWDAMSPEERDDYRQNTTDEGNKRLDFLFAL
ncbi:Major Facilitator Superfamily [Geosmithia morbida]|uniref:Major Facilitator Superfamily n=1 Tax=Geosmithia morbida TaxID=1094350 RepID=A0A9P4YSC1_9HYPO|nr:Major Facilitator Superfamily [Geosmithia morbida]KAF4122228.1 Major Facilitator Superfamily [Geosmithia morbida]